MNLCQVWNRGGVVLVEGIFVPYDRGPAVKTDALKIVDGRNSTDAVQLENCRLLIPQLKEAEVRRRLDERLRRE